jgi:hypothetical protein
MFHDGEKIVVDQSRGETPEIILAAIGMAAIALESPSRPSACTSFYTSFRDGEVFTLIHGDEDRHIRVRLAKTDDQCVLELDTVLYGGDPTELLDTAATFTENLTRLRK